MQETKQVEEYLEKIKSQADIFNRLSVPFRKDIETEQATDKFSTDYWRRNAYGNALVRLRQLAENNFHYIETLGLLATARYIFELSIWLRLFEKDARYCTIYYRELINKQLRYYEDTLAHLNREVALLKEFESLDESNSNIILQKMKKGEIASDYAETSREAMSQVDAKASRCFSLYLDQAKTNGYGFQAYLVEKKAIPQAESAIAEIKKEQLEFEKHTPKDVQKLVPKRWQWKQMSEIAGIVSEHDYIYSYASKLLHATPASLTTDQKNLEVSEICLFLRYIHVKMLEIARLAHTQPECDIQVVS